MSKASRQRAESHQRFGLMPLLFLGGRIVFIAGAAFHLSMIRRTPQLGTKKGTVPLTNPLT